MNAKLKMNHGGHDLLKQVVGAPSFTLTDMVEGEYSAISKPRLLTSLLNPSVNTHMTKSLTYDVETRVANLPSGKSYSEEGAQTKHDYAETKAFAIPSFGLVGSMYASEWSGRRKPNSTELWTPETVVQRIQEQITDGYDLMNEYGLARLITADSNILLGGAGTAYDYSASIDGTTRTSAGTYDFTAADSSWPKFVEFIEDKMDEVTEYLQKRGKNPTGFALVCGKNVFSAARSLFAQIETPRELRTALDLASMGMTVMDDGEWTNYRMFDSEAGFAVIRYAATILGEKLIGDGDFYLIPTGVENMLSIELAPGDFIGAVNREADAMYMFVEEDKRSITVASETNRLFFNKNPGGVLQLTATLV